MEISKLIVQLQRIQDEHGDIECFTNGEHGVLQTIPLEKRELAAGPAKITLDEEYMEFADMIDEQDIVLNIGGF